MAEFGIDSTHALEVVDRFLVSAGIELRHRELASHIE